MAVSEVTPFVVLGAAAITALSTLAGVLLANRAAATQLGQRLCHVEETARKEALRVRLEELYQSIEQWAGSVVSHYILYREVMYGRLTYNEALDVTIENGSQEDAARIFMLADLYFPDCHALLEEMKASRDEAASVLGDFKERYRVSGEASRDHSSKLTSALERFNESVAAYKAALAKYAREV